MPLITIENLSCFYEGKRVFENLNFTVEEGDYLCILGENGSGKTTLMKTILGFDIKHTGSIRFDDFSNKEIGWLPQKTQYQNDFPASALEVVMSGFAGSGFLGFRYSKSQKITAKKNMQLLDLTDIAEKSFSELSGGQQQKVLLCRALCAAKKVILLDEPVTSLDEATAKEMYDIIKKLNDNGTAVIMISHDIMHAVKHSKHILRLSDDIFFGTKNEYQKYISGDM